jgi:AcrR family transcriptional regulator
MSKVGEGPVHHRKPVRPTKRGQARRQAFLDAARGVFYEVGYEAASVNDVVQRAGGSLATLYNQFENKEGLFLALIEDGVAGMRASLVAPDLPIRPALSILAKNYLEGVMAPGAIGTFRILVGEGRKFPQLAEKFFELGPMRLRADLSAFLAARTTQGEIHCADPDFAAQAFFDMLRSQHRVRRSALPEKFGPEIDYSSHIEKVVSLFLAGVAPR